MEDLCRICRKRCLYNSTYIHSSHDGVSVSEMLIKTCPIDITSDDPIGQLLPQSICNDCFEVISAAFNLQRVCIESDQYFRSMIGSDQVVVKEEVFEQLMDIKEEEMEVSEYLGNITDDEYVTCLVPVEEKKKPAATVTFNPRQTVKTGNQPHYECNFCLVQLRIKHQMLKHMKKEHDPISLPYGCDFCSARFKNEGTKSIHEGVKHVGEISSIIVCKMCGINGICEQGMRSHMIDDHKMNAADVYERGDEAEGKFHPRPFNKATRYEDVFYYCNFCNIKLKPRINMLRHMLEKHDPQSLPFYCKYCDQRFKVKSEKKVHEKTHNPSDKLVLVCEICTATGTRELGMKEHKIDDHPLPRPESPKQTPKIPTVNFTPRPLPGSESLNYEDTWYLCNFCEKKIKPKMSMLRHMRKHSAEEYPFACEFCVMRFETFNELDSHVSYSHDEDSPKVTIFCDLCGVSGDSKEGMQHHMEDDHMPKRKQSRKKLCAFRCNFCKAKFTQEQRLFNHMLAKHMETTKCEKCDEEFNNKKDMENHVMMVHSKLYRQVEPHEIETSLKCCKCEKNHNTEAELMEHIETHEPSFSHEKTKCLFCPRNLKTFDEFFEHVKYHAQPQTHECLTCKKKLPYDDKLFSHVKNHKRYDCYKVECKKCQQKFRSAKDLEIHDKIKHNKETLFMCPICAKSLCSANGLDQHIRYVHNKEQEMKFQCRFCPMKFILKTKLTRHEAVHSTERPHVCEICGNSFKHMEGLSLHMKRHNGTLERKHKCTQCTNKFTTKHRLDQHMMTHSGLKPHECKYCDRAYASKGDLVKHMQKLHVGDAVYQCDKCPRGFRLIVELREHQQEHGDSNN